MKRSLLNGFVSMGIALLVACSVQGQSYGGGRLAGTWDADVRIFNCDTNFTITEFKSTANFDRDGTFTGITSGTSPANRTPEVGVWRHREDGTYRFKFKAYLFSPAGIAVGYQIVSHDISLSADNSSYTSAGAAKIFAMNGVQTGAVCSEGVGTRFTLD